MQLSYIIVKKTALLDEECLSYFVLIEKIIGKSGYIFLIKV